MSSKGNLLIHAKTVLGPLLYARFCDVAVNKTSQVNVLPVQSRRGRR